MDAKIITGFTHNTANVIKRNGAIDKALKPAEQAVDSFINTASKGIIKDNKENIFVKAVNTPLKALAGIYKYFNTGLKSNGKENILRKISKSITGILYKNDALKKTVLESSGKIPFIGAAIVTAGLLWGLGKTVVKTIKENTEEGSKELVRTIIKTACSALAAVGLTATGAGALLSGAGAVTGLAIGDKISDEVLGTGKEKHSAEKKEGAKEGKEGTEETPHEVVLQGFPTLPSGGVSDKEFDRMLDYVGAVAHY